MTLLDYFDSVSLINLPERTDRLRAARKEFERVGWTLSDDDVFAAHRFEDAAGFPTAGYRGCFQSHLDCLRKARQKGARNALVFEDDITLSSALPRVTASLIEQLERKEWALVNFGHEESGPIGIAGSETQHVELVPYVGHVLQAHFYAVHGDHFDRLIEHFEILATGERSDIGMVPMSPDGAYNVYRRMNPDALHLVASPKLGWQGSSRSDLMPRSIDKISVLAPLLSTMRVVKRQLMRR